MLALRFFRSFLASSALVLSLSAQSVSSSVVLSPSAAPQFLSGDDLEGDLNCDEVVFARLGVRSIVQNVPAMGAEFGASMRARAKTLMLAAVVGSESVLNSYLEQGVLAGLEFDWFFPTGGAAPTTYRLPGEVDVFVQGAGGELRLVARVYGYDAAQYDKRRMMVQMMISHPMRVYPVWTEDVVCSSGGHGSQLAITGFSNVLHGRAASSASLLLSGVRNRLVDGVLVAGECLIQRQNQVAFVTHGDLVSGPSVPFTEAAARALAHASGLYVAGDLSLDEASLPAGGIVFAEGSIQVNASRAYGSYTFVSASGSVHFRGEENSFEPQLSDVLAVSFAEKVVVAGDGNAFLGELHAPAGSIEVSGSANTLIGILAGDSAAITGSRNVVTDGTHPSTLP